MLPPSGKSQDPKGTAYHLTLDSDSSRHPVSTGISAHDRAYTARLLASGAGAGEFTRPGHLVPLQYTSGGVRRRRGHTECAVGESSSPHYIIFRTRRGESDRRSKLLTCRLVLPRWLTPCWTPMRACTPLRPGRIHGAERRLLALCSSVGIEDYLRSGPSGVCGEGRQRACPGVDWPSLHCMHLDP